MKRIATYVLMRVVRSRFMVVSGLLTSNIITLVQLPSMLRLDRLKHQVDVLFALFARHV